MTILTCTTDWQSRTLARNEAFQCLGVEVQVTATDPGGASANLNLGARLLTYHSWTFPNTTVVFYRSRYATAASPQLIAVEPIP